MVPKSFADNFSRAWSANRTSSTYGTMTDLATLPAVGAVDTTNGYIDLEANPAASNVCDAVKLKFYGVGSDNTTGNCRVYGLTGVKSATGTSFTHVLLADFAFTLSTDVGVAGGVVTASERYADTITRTIGIENVADQILSPANNVSGHALVDVKGFRYLYIEPIVGASSPATSVNVLYARV